jgi:protein-S-isoprenylcysteine O-methyltransferase Ste14
VKKRGPHGGELFGIMLLGSVAIDVAACVWISPQLLRVPCLWANGIVSALSIALGLAALIAGSLLGYASHEAFKQAVSPRGEVKHVLKTGPYRLVRHPFYLSLILIALGFFLLLRSYALLAGLLAVAVTLMAEAREEERVLVELFREEYLSYQEHTGMLVPRRPRR